MVGLLVVFSLTLAHQAPYSKTISLAHPLKFQAHLCCRILSFPWIDNRSTTLLYQGAQTTEEQYGGNYARTYAREIIES